MTTQGAQTPWYLDPITQSFNGKEKGVDLGVPYHTPITALFSGIVTGVKTGPYGQEVDVTGMLNGQQVTSSYVHLDQALVAVGQPVNQMSELGLSGGQLHGGAHPAQAGWSSGPHIEFSLWPGGSTPYVGSPYNPMSFIQSVQGSQGGILASLGMNTSASAAGATGGLPGLPSGWQNVLQGMLLGAAGTPQGQTLINVQAPDIAGGITAGASNIGHNILGSLGASKFSDLLWRAALLLVAFILIVVVAQAITMKGTQTIVEGVASSKPVQTATKVASMVK